MMIGHAKDHDGDSYRMWNLETGGVHETTRDMIWLKQMFYKKTGHRTKHCGTSFI